MGCQVFLGICFLDWMSGYLGDLGAGLLGLPCRPSHLVPGDCAQIVGEKPQADPALHPILAMIATLLQPLGTFEPTDPPFNPGPPVASPPEPALPLVCQARRSLAPWPRQHHLAHPTLLRQPFVGWCGQLAIGRQQIGRTPELLDMMLQTRCQLRRVVRIAIQDAIATDDPALDLIEPDTAPEFG